MEFLELTPEDLVEAITDRVKLHHELYTSPVKDDLWEEVLHRSLADLGISTDWQADENHGSGKDMTTEHGERISCKSGQLKTRRGVKNLTISGSRLTKHATLKDKVKFISDKKEDVYCLLSREVGDKTGENYKFIIFPSGILNYGDIDWQETYGIRGKMKGKVNGYSADSDLLECKIQKSMSDQLWTTIKDIDNNENILVYDIEM